MLKVRDLTKRFRIPGKSAHETPVLSVDFDISRNTVTALTGASGAGKSTIARILCGAVKADSGTGFFDGKPLFEGGIYHKGTGFGIQLIPQFPGMALDPRMRIGDSVAEVLVCHRLASRREAAEQSRELLRAVGLNPGLAGRYPAQLSGGQTQRAVIARTLAISPRLLVADEATSMLDMPAQSQIIDLLLSLVESRGLSVLLISHDRELVSSIAAREYALDGGNLKLIR